MMGIQFPPPMYPKNLRNLSYNTMAERVGFEPTKELPLC